MLLRASTAGVTLDAPRDFTTLSLVLEGPDAEAAAARLGTWIDRDHLVVPPQTLVELAGPVATEAGWQAGFDTMMEHAGRRGLVEDTGGVRVHVEKR